MDPKIDPLATMTPEVRAALERYVLHHGPGTSPYFPSRYFDNEAWTKDVATLAAAFASGVSPRAVGPGDCKACEGSGRQSVADGPIAVTARKRDDAGGPGEAEAWKKRAAKAESAYHAKSEELARLLSRPGPDAGMPEDVRAAAQRLKTLDNWLYNGLDNFPDGLTESGLVEDARMLAAFVLSLPPSRGYDAGFVAGIEAAASAAEDFAPIDSRDARHQGAREAVRRIVATIRHLAPGADRDAGK